MKDKLKNIGKKASVTPIGMGAFTVNVKIVDYKNTYGRDRWLVTPISGTGEVWVEKVSF